MLDPHGHGWNSEAQNEDSVEANLPIEDDDDEGSR
jgi:hypothetical protein